MSTCADSPRLFYRFGMVKNSNVAYLSPSGTERAVYHLNLRGGESNRSTANSVMPSEQTKTETDKSEEPSLDDKVLAAMKKLGIPIPSQATDDFASTEFSVQSNDGVCLVPTELETASNIDVRLGPAEIADRIANDMNVNVRLSMAAVSASATLEEGGHKYSEAAARKIIQQELDIIASNPADSEHVKTLKEEGFDDFFARRALAIVENNLEDARAILIADQMDAEQEEHERQRLQDDKELEFVEVEADFDPTKLPIGRADTSSNVAAQSVTATTNNIPKAVSKDSVVFEASTAQIQELVLESPVPVLLDFYANWCGPCQVLGPALEEMTVKSGGIFRLVKVNADTERPVSEALAVTALPSVFGVRDGKIVHMFQGVPKSEDMIKNFMMGLFGSAPFSPPLTPHQVLKYEELTKKLVKAAGAASFSFSDQERLTDRISSRLDDLAHDASVKDAEDKAALIRTLLNNIILHPDDTKYRTIKLENKVLRSRLGGNASCLAILKVVGFVRVGTEMIIGKERKVFNVAPLVVARDCIDKWVQSHRREKVMIARKEDDERDRAELSAGRENEVYGEDEDEVASQRMDPVAVILKIRVDGKKQVHEVVLSRDDPLLKVLEVMSPELNSPYERIQLVCASKRLVVRANNTEAMKKSIGEYDLMPSTSIVIKVGPSGSASQSTSSSRLKERAEMKQKKGSHTMQSIGVYSKDDNNKAELIDGGGGVWYEHDVSDDDDESENVTSDGATKAAMNTSRADEESNGD